MWGYIEAFESAYGYSPKVGDKFSKHGKTYKVIRVSPDTYEASVSE